MTKSSSVTTLPVHQNMEQPHSSEAEQALLGLLMLNNQLFDHIEGDIKSEHFYVPVHAAIFDAMEILIAKGFEASPISIKDTIKNKELFGSAQELGELLVNLFENATRANDVRMLARIIYTFYLQREMLKLTSRVEADMRDTRTLEETQRLMGEAEATLFKLAETGTVKESTDLRNPLKNVISQIEVSMKTAGSLLGVTSGFNNLDKYLGGFQRSDLIILAARPSMGKTAFAANVAYNAAHALRANGQGGAGVGLFSLEMSSEQIATRLLSSASHVDSGKIIRGDVNDAEMEVLVNAAADLSDLPIIIDDTPGITLSQFRARARRMARKHDLGMIVVDYLQLLHGDGRNDNRVQEISMISQTLKAVARELNVPIIALSQLSRAVENRDNKRPQLSDLRESGSIEQDADVVMFLYREEYYLDKQLGLDDGDKKQIEIKERLEKVRGITELLISKNRKGSTGRLMFTFDGPTTTFHPYAGEASYPDGVEA